MTMDYWTLYDFLPFPHLTGKSEGRSFKGSIHQELCSKVFVRCVLDIMSDVRGDLLRHSWEE